MQIRKIVNAWLLAAALGCYFLPESWAQQPAPGTPNEPTGEWLVAKRIARIKIVDCSGRLWGVVSWEAQPGTDSKNPDPNLRTRPTLGMPILLGMTPSSSRPNQWEGQIYNSEDGQTYSASITLSDPNTLRVQGCVLGFLCGGENWSRADDQGTVGGAPTQAPPKPPARKPATSAAPGRKTASAPEAPSDDVCSRVAGTGTTGFSHERRLK